MRQPFRADAARYALYFTPPLHSPWWQAGRRWLEHGTDIPALAVSPIQALTANPRRYGFHATLKAPFKLTHGVSQAQLLSMAASIAQTQRPITLSGLEVRLLDDYLALCLQTPLTEIGALAMRCVKHFDALRAAPDDAELARRRQAGLSVRQEELLARWGYPFTEELYRFHMTLTGDLSDVDAATVAVLRDAAIAHFQPLLTSDAPIVDALSVCIEPEPGEPFSVLQRFAFTAAGDTRASVAVSTAAAIASPTATKPGRLFYLVGPSGVGKDSLLQWLQQHLGENTRTVFARRAITRQPHPSELHEQIDTDTFWEQVCHGEFSMFWQANGACYGVRREIEADMRAGRDVIVNGSRAYSPCVRQAFPEARIIWLTADPETISQRLISRQRETGAALVDRVARAAQYVPPIDESVIAIDNSGALEVAGARLLALLQRG
ncbi:MAG: phosphonate metabolism protein/1,5-bisphosphokinase (PRPP-forming) PhnN [Pseudomonadota bacterium]